MRTHKIALSGAMLCLALSGIALTGTGCAGDRYQRSTGAYIDDKGITTRVKTALFRDPNVSGFDVHVNTFRGDVQLSGFVDTPDQKEHAAALAREVAGVRAVTNNLEVKPKATAVGTPGTSVEGTSRTVTQPAPENPAADNVRTPAPMDTNIERNRQELRDQSRDLNPSSNLAPAEPAPASGPSTSTLNEPLPSNQPKIDISSSNGRATLRGTVSSEDEKRSIARKLLAVPGIVTIDNQLEVQPTAPPK